MFLLLPSSFVAFVEAESGGFHSRRQKMDKEKRPFALPVPAEAKPSESKTTGRKKARTGRRRVGTSQKSTRPIPVMQQQRRSRSEVRSKDDDSTSCATSGDDRYVPWEDVQKLLDLIENGSGGGCCCRCAGCNGRSPPIEPITPAQRSNVGSGKSEPKAMKNYRQNFAMKLESGQSQEDPFEGTLRAVDNRDENWVDRDARRSNRVVQRCPGEVKCSFFRGTVLEIVGIAVFTLLIVRMMRN